MFLGSLLRNPHHLPISFTILLDTHLLLDSLLDRRRIGIPPMVVFVNVYISVFVVVMVMVVVVDDLDDIVVVMTPRAEASSTVNDGGGERRRDGRSDEGDGCESEENGRTGSKDHFDDVDSKWL